MASENLTNNRS